MNRGFRRTRLSVAALLCSSLLTGVPQAAHAAAPTAHRVTFNPATTTRLRVSLQSGQGSVGLLEMRTYS
jgi:hypothetical protein